MGEAALDPTIVDLRRAMARVNAGTESEEDGVVPDVLTVPAGLADLFPWGGLARGSVVSVTGSGSLLLSIIAASTEDGAHVAVVGIPRLSMLAAVEMGADLSRVALVADPGPDRLQIATVLLDGMDLVVLGLDGMSVPPSRAKVLAARARRNSSVLLVVGGQWPGAAAQLSARVSRYRTAPGALGPGACGYGRINGWDLSVSVRARSRPPRSVEFSATASRGGVQ